MGYAGFLERTLQQEFGGSSQSCSAEPSEDDASRRTDIRETPSHTPIQKQLNQPQGHPLKKTKFRIKIETVESGSEDEAAGKPNLASAVKVKQEGKTSSQSSSSASRESPRLWAASCRVWLPAAVLPAGDALVKHLVGENEANLDHLRRKYPNAGVELQGKASMSVPPEKRLRLAVLFGSGVDAGLVLDAVDLVETACDLAGEE